MSQRPRGQAYGAPRFASAADVRYQRQRQPDPRIAPPPVVPPGLTDFLNQLPPPSQWPAAALSYFVVDPLLALTTAVISVVISPRTHRIVLRLGVLMALFWLALALAIAGYVGFYRAWVPDIGLTRPVWLQYGHDQPPFANIPLHLPHDSTLGIFAQDQEYDVSLDLVVPLSAANLDLGNFMVSLDLKSPLNRTILHISKPTIIVHEPAPVRAMSNLMFQLTRHAPTYILPTSSPPVQLITISLLHRTILQPAHAAHPFGAIVLDGGVSQAVVSVGRLDADKYWKYGGGHGVGGVMPQTGGIMRAAAEGFRSRGELQTHSASLRFDAHLTGLRWFMYHQPLAAFLFFTSLFMAFELLSALTLWAIAAFYTSSLTQPNLAVEDNYMGTRPVGLTTDSEVTPRPATGGDDGYESDTVTGEEDEGHEEGDIVVETPSLTPSQRQSLASLHARDAQERFEQRRAEMLRDEAEGRLMTAVDEPQTGALDDLHLGLLQQRRVLGRLDEETEEETDVRSSTTSAGWEDVGEEGDVFAGNAGLEHTAAGPGLRQRRSVKEEDEEILDADVDDFPQRFARQGTVGGSSTSRASSVQSFGATSLGADSIAPSSTAPSRSQTQATPEIKEEDAPDTPRGSPGDILGDDEDSPTTPRT